ncbi:glycoside hydrolase [Actinomadura rayongensis]|uniref:Beta-1,6-galactanase n=1 Tax=Actinomadura rayongensis TaxID=1429076 RepID=A0A6I4W6C2_9ACTN|nr:beta-1,6-galactanase [Actinomadura rayongensis]
MPERVVDPHSVSFPWDGWGVCLSWWAGTELGRRDDLARALFGRGPARVRLADRDVTLPGLGLTVVRYNLGACTWPRPGDGPARMVESPRIVRRKQIEAPWRGTDWNWAADANQRAMLRKARAIGADRFEMFSVSPPWWMTVNGNPSGAERPDQDNLSPAHRETYARYIAAVARHARDHWNVHFASVEPFNEPSLQAWHASQNQEGCHFTVDAQAAVLTPLRRALDARGLHDVRIAASDECFYSQATNTWRDLPADVRRLIGRVNVHGYERDDDSVGRAALRTAIGATTPLWQSEYCDGEPAGLRTALNIGRDLRSLRPRAWVYWQPVDGLGWGLLTGAYDDTTPNPTGGAPGTLRAEVTEVNAKYYVLAQYTRHIRPGMHILDSGHPDTVAAYDVPARRLTLVTANSAVARTVTYDLRRFARAEGRVRVWATDATDDVPARAYTRERDAPIADRLLTLTHAPNTVTTMEADDVEP